MTESVYHGLNVERHQIRLLELAPGKPQDPINVRLSITSLDITPPPVYEAISYEWGSPNVTENINVSSVDFRITTNLKAALTRFRLPDRTRMLWADAICIDQQNTSERSSQVQIMGRVYSECERVLVYLSAEEPGDKEAFDFIKSPGKTKNAFKNCQRSWWRSKFTCETVFKIFGRLAAKTWWLRSWTAQEIILAPQATLYCGKLEAEWEKFVEAAELIKNATFSGIWCQTCLGNVSTFIDLVWPIRVNCHVPLLDRKDILQIVVLNRARLSTDPRDKLFAFLGVAHPSHSIASDYSARVEEVYLNFAWTSFTRLGTLQALGSVISNQQSEFRLPSWVPNWTEYLFSSIRMRESVNFFAYNMYNACLDKTFDGSLDLSSPSPSLLLSGIKVGEVVQVSENCEFMSSSAIKYDFTTWRTVADVDVEPLRSYVSGLCCVRNAFWRTVMMDITTIPGVDSGKTLQRPIPAECEAPFWKYLEMSESTVVSLVRKKKGGNPFQAGITSTHIGVRIWAEGRRFGVLKDGLFVNGPPGTEVSDEVWIAKGGKMPLVLRRTEALGQETGTTIAHVP